MALRKYVPSCDASSSQMKSLSFSGKVRANVEPVEQGTQQKLQLDVSVDHKEVYFLIMHFLSSGPCKSTYFHLWNELLEHNLLPRRYHAWYSRSGDHSGHEKDDGTSFPLNYNLLIERYILQIELFECALTMINCKITLNEGKKGVWNG